MGKVFHQITSKRGIGHGFPSKRVLIWNSGTCSNAKKGHSGAPPRHTQSLKRCTASYTVEAAVVLPVFACLCVFVMLFFRILAVEWGVETAIREVGENLALYGESRYLSGADSNEEGESIGEVLTTVGIAAAVTSRIYSLGVPVDYIDLGILGIDYSDVNVSKDDIDITVSYRISLPFKLFGKHTYDVTQTAKYRRWVGFDPSKADEEKDEYVYVARYGEDYHKDRNCPYLAPSVKGVPYKDVGKERNKSGGKYHPCSLCTKNASPTLGGGFITDYGTTYHYSNSCSGLKRTVYTMELSEAKKKYRACPKCY